VCHWSAAAGKARRSEEHEPGDLPGYTHFPSSERVKCGMYIFPALPATGENGLRLSLQKAGAFLRKAKLGAGKGVFSE